MSYTKNTNAASSSSSSSSPAPAPKLPEPDFSNLTKEELDQLKRVLQRQEQFENEIENSICGLKKTMSYLIENQKNQSNHSISSLNNNNNNNVIKTMPMQANPGKSVATNALLFELKNPDAKAPLAQWSQASTANNLTKKLPFSFIKKPLKQQQQPLVSQQNQQQQPSTEQTKSDMTVSGSFLSRFTSLKSLVDENLNSPSETADSSTGAISSGFFSKFSSTSVSSSTSSLLNKQQTVCHLCKRQAPLLANENDTTIQSKFKKWKFNYLAYNNTNNNLFDNKGTKGESTLLQCHDCSNYVCDRCGNMTSPDLVFTRPNDSNLKENAKNKWRCKLCIVKREVSKKSGVWVQENSETKSLKQIINQLSHKVESSSKPLDDLCNENEKKDKEQTDKSLKSTMSEQSVETKTTPINSNLDSTEQISTSETDEKAMKKKLRNKLKTIVLVTNAARKFSRISLLPGEVENKKVANISDEQLLCSSSSSSSLPTSSLSFLHMEKSYSITETGAIYERTISFDANAQQSCQPQPQPIRSTPIQISKAIINDLNSEVKKSKSGSQMTSSFVTIQQQQKHSINSPESPVLNLSPFASRITTQSSSTIFNFQETKPLYSNSPSKNSINSKTMSPTLSPLFKQKAPSQSSSMKFNQPQLSPKLVDLDSSTSLSNTLQSNVNITGIMTTNRKDLFLPLTTHNLIYAPDIAQDSPINEIVLNTPMNSTGNDQIAVSMKSIQFIKESQNQSLDSIGPLDFRYKLNLDTFRLRNAWNGSGSVSNSTPPISLDEWRRRSSLQSSMSSSDGSSCVNPSGPTARKHSSSQVDTHHYNTSMPLSSVRETRRYSLNQRLNDYKINKVRMFTSCRAADKVDSLSSDYDKIRTNTERNLANFSQLLAKHRQAMQRKKHSSHVKRANSLFEDSCCLNEETVQCVDTATGPTEVPLSDKKRRLPDTDKSNSTPTRGSKKSKGSSSASGKPRSYSNDVMLNTSDLAKFIQQQQESEHGQEELADLAKVILIEHKRSLQMSQTRTEDSSISFTPHGSTDSRRDSFSSRQDSSISVNENEMVRSNAKQMATARADYQRRKNIKNSEEWNKRRKDLMKKAKKWSNAIDDQQTAGDGDETGSKDNDDTGGSSNFVNESGQLDGTDESMASNSDLNLSRSTAQHESLVEEVETASIEPVEVKSNNPVEKAASIQTADDRSGEIESNKMIYHQSSVNFNFSTESSRQFGIKPLSIDTSVEKITHSGQSSPVVFTRKPTRKLPQVPKSGPSPNSVETVPMDSLITQASKDRSDVSEATTVKANEIESKPDAKASDAKDELERINSTSSSGSNKKTTQKTSTTSNEDIESLKAMRRNRVKLNETKSSSTTKSSSNFSKSIDSSDSFKQKSKENRLKNTKSVDLERHADKNNPNHILVGSMFSPQRSIDYPYIVRKTPKLSDIVRKRLLFQKVSRNATFLGESFSNSVEKEHVPKAPRKIIIRQDNSIEISLTRPPKLRRQTISEDFTPTNYNQLADSNETPTTTAMQALAVKNPSMLSVSSNGNDRRKTIETCENIFLQSEESTKLRARTPPSNPHRILLYKDKSDKSIRTNGLGMIVTGGQECEDGSLGCFVTLVIKGGPADINNIEVGDQILEFNGHSLIDSTYEEVRNYQNNSGDYVQLVVHHNNIRHKLGSTSSPLEISRHFETVPRLCQSNSRKRRNLPPLPMVTNQINRTENNRSSLKTKDYDYIVAETLHVPQTSSLLKPILINRGRLLMQIWDNCKDFKLAVTINQASSLPPRAESEKWYSFIAGRVIFEEQAIQTFKTNASPNVNPVWNETFVFEYTESVEEATLEICVHDTQLPNDTRLLRENFVGMIILPLSEANLEDEPRWYELRDKPTRKTSTASVTFKSSSNDSQDSLCEKKKKSSRKSSRKSSIHNSENKEAQGDSPGTSFSNLSKITPVRKLSRALSRLLSFRRSSESAMKKNEIQFESEEEELEVDDKNISMLKPNRSNQRRHTELLSVNFLLPPTSSSRSSSITSSRKSSNTSNIEIEEDIDSYFSAEQKNQLNDPTPGLGQVPPKSDLKSSQNIDDIVAGDIKLGFVMSKGQLEITVYEGRLASKLPIDTYVKTYLRTGTHKLHKKKTHVAKNSCEPVFNTKLHYNACNVLGRRIQVVMIWQKGPKLDKNQCIGEAFIQLDCLDLSHQTISWYKLYKQHVVDSDFYDST